MITLEGGKYTVTNTNGLLHFTRYGEAWPAADDLRHAGVVLALVQEVERLQIAVDAGRDLEKPIDMVLYCPRCCVQHVDAALVETPDFDSMPDAPIMGLIAPEDLVERLASYRRWQEANWTNPPHRSHLCHSCGFVWRPADVPTTGVAAITSKGKDDSPLLPPVPR